jgi:histidinol-phosphatase
MNKELSFAFELADIADRTTLKEFGASDLGVSSKPDMTPVSRVDREVEQALREHIGAQRPGHLVTGEEFGTSEGDGTRWIIDPIDGTKNYVRSIPVYATLLALEKHGQLVLGVVSAPALNRRWWAVRRQGAFANGKPIRTSAVADLADAQLCYGGLTGWDRRGLNEQFLALLRRCSRTRGFGDFWTHMLVAEGAADIGVEPQGELWDLAALQVIVEEAGGRFTDLEGVAWASGGSAVSTNGLLHDQVLAAFHRG